MSLKTIIDQILREEHRSLSWLAVGMGKTFDGLRLALINESLKYKDIVIMAKVLNTSPSRFFKAEEELSTLQNNLVAEPASEYGDSLRSCRELTAALKDQLKDKERIISLLNQTIR